MVRLLFHFRLASKGPTVPKAQQLPQFPWSRTGVSIPKSLQSKEAGSPKTGVSDKRGFLVSGVEGLIQRRVGIAQIGNQGNLSRPEGDFHLGGPGI